MTFFDQGPFENPSFLAGWPREAAPRSVENPADSYQQAITRAVYLQCEGYSDDEAARLTGVDLKDLQTPQPDTDIDPVQVYSGRSGADKSFARLGHLPTNMSATEEASTRGIDFETFMEG